MEFNNMANKKKERNPQHETNSISPTLSYIHNGMHVTISFAESSDHTVCMENLVDILFGSFEQER